MNTKILYTLALVVPFGMVVLGTACWLRNAWLKHRNHLGPVIPV